jgi:hypothetical protein
MYNSNAELESFNCKSCDRGIFFTAEQVLREAILTCTCGHKIHLGDYKQTLLKGIKNTKDMVAERKKIAQENRRKLQ